MTSIPIPSTPNRLFIVTARLEFQYPVLAESREAAESQRVTKEAMNDLGEVPWDISADAAGPDYPKPDGYDGDCLVYFGRPPHVDVTWDDAVKADMAFAAHFDVVERLDYTKPPAGFLPSTLGHGPMERGFGRYRFAYTTPDGATVQETLQLPSDEEAIAALWGKVKLGRDPPGMHLIAMGRGWGPTNDVKGQGAARRALAWAIYDHRLGLHSGSAPWPLVLTWDDAACEAFEKA